MGRLGWQGRSLQGESRPTGKPGGSGGLQPCRAGVGARIHCRRRAGCGWPRGAAPGARLWAPRGPAALRGLPWPPGPPGHVGRPAHPAWLSGAGCHGSAPGEALPLAVSPGLQALVTATCRVPLGPAAPTAHPHDPEHIWLVSADHRSHLPQAGPRGPAWLAYLPRAAGGDIGQATECQPPHAGTCVILPGLQTVQQWLQEHQVTCHVAAEQLEAEVPPEARASPPGPTTPSAALLGSPSSGAHGLMPRVCSPQLLTPVAAWIHCCDLRPVFGIISHSQPGRALAAALPHHGAQLWQPLQPAARSRLGSGSAGRAPHPPTPPCLAPTGGPEHTAPTSARKAVEVVLWISYVLLCMHMSAFITRGSRGPANLAIALGKEATQCRHYHRGLPQAHLGPPTGTLGHFYLQNHWATGLTTQPLRPCVLSPSPLRAPSRTTVLATCSVCPVGAPAGP